MGVPVHGRDTLDRLMRVDRPSLPRFARWLAYLAAGVLGLGLHAAARRRLSFRKPTVRRPALGQEPG